MTDRRPASAHRFKIFRIFHARPRLTTSLLIAVAVALILPEELIRHALTRAIVGWNVGIAIYLGLAAHMMFWSSHERMRARALQEDEGRYVVLALVIFAALVALGAVMAQLAAARDLHGTLRYAHAGLAALTLGTAWAFTQVMFALHYAHDYYGAEIRGHGGGLDFPGGHAPDYGDFLYFACVIGTSGQTADVSLTSRLMRRVGLTHCVLAFFFNTTVLALTINIASGLL